MPNPKKRLPEAMGGLRSEILMCRFAVAIAPIESFLITVFVWFASSSARVLGRMMGPYPRRGLFPPHRRAWPASEEQELALL
jgi:hypothetical protein